MSIKKLIPPFNAERQLKATLATTMYTDANDFLLRTNILLKDIELLSYAYLSKIYVDILMSIESNLKTLIIILSKNDETPENVYKEARKHSHKIADLYNEVENRAFRRIKLLSEKNKNELLNNAIKITVNNRYRLVTLTQIRSEGINTDWGLGEYSNLINYEYIRELQKTAFMIHEITNKASGKYLDRMGMKGTNIEKFDDRFQEFLSNSRL